MKRIIALALVVLMALPAAGKKKVNLLQTVGIRYLSAPETFTTYDRLQKTIHDYAEPGYLEYKSSKAIADHLAANGFTIEWGVAGIPTAFIATYGSGHPVIGMLGEYDALPGMSQDTSTVDHPLVEGACGHACGHNLLGTGPCAGAVATAKWLAEGHAGTVKYFGCPAEEGGGGKAYMTRAGCFNGCDAILDWHPGDGNGVSLTSGLANVRVNFTFHGIPSHAGVSPWEGRSALDAVESFNYMMNMMREHVPMEARIHYIISNGGQAPNVVPATAQVVYYIRHPKAEVVLDIFHRALQAAEGAAMGTGTKMTYEIVNGNYEKLGNSVIAEVMNNSLQMVGGVVLDEREKAYCAEIMRNSGWEVDLSNFEEYDKVVENGFSGGSSDVGNVSQMAPLASMRICTCVKHAGLHSWQQCTIGGTTIGTKALINVGKIFYLSAIQLMQDPKTIQAAWDEYYAARGHEFKFVPLMGDREPPFDYCKGK